MIYLMNCTLVSNKFCCSLDMASIYDWQAEKRNQELKHKHHAITGHTLSSTTDATDGELELNVVNDNILSVAQGNDEDERNGRQIECHSVSIRGTMEMLGVSTTWGAEEVMIALVLDTQHNGSNIASEDVFRNAAGSKATVPFCQERTTYRNRFHILKRLNLQIRHIGAAWNGVTAGSGNGLKSFHMEVPLTNLVVNYTGTNGTTDQIMDNSLTLIAFSTDYVQNVIFHANIRLRYYG